MRHRPRHLLVMLLLLWVPCHAIGLASIAWGDEPYRISADDGAPMFGDVSQMLRAAYRRLGLEIKIVTRPGRRSVTEANEGLFDGELVRAPVIEQHFHHLIRVPTQVATIDIVALVGKDPIRIASRADLASLRVGYERGVMLIENDPASVGFYAGNNLDALLKLLAEGKLDVVLDVAHDFHLARQRLGLEQVRVTDFIFASAPFYHYLHERHLDLVAPLAKAIHEERILRGL